MSIKPVDSTAAGLIASYVMPMLEQELVRLQGKCDRRTLASDEMHKLLELTRAAVALRYVDIRVAEGEAKAKTGGEDLANLSTEELHAKAVALLKKANPNYDGKNLQALRAPKDNH